MQRVQIENLDEEELTDVYGFGLEVGASWGLRWMEFLYQTPEGEKIRRELSRDFIAWQKQEFGIDDKSQLLTIRQFLARAFPLDVAPARGAGTKTKKDLKRRAVGASKIKPVKKPKPVKGQGKAAGTATGPGKTGGSRGAAKTTPSSKAAPGKAATSKTTKGVTTIRRPQKFKNI